MENYYKILNIKPGTNQQEIHKAFLQLAKLYHPDNFANRDDPEEFAVADKIFKQINEAYSVLSDPARRKQYDDGMKTVQTGKETVDQAAERKRFARMHFNYGVNFYSQGKYDESITEFHMAMEQGYEESGIYGSVAMAYAKNGDKPAALEFARRYLETDEKSAESQFYMGLVWEALRDAKEARSWYKKALKKNPGHVNARQRLRVISYRPGGLAAVLYKLNYLAIGLAVVALFQVVLPIHHYFVHRKLSPPALKLDVLGAGTDNMGHICILDWASGKRMVFERDGRRVRSDVMPNAASLERYDHFDDRDMVLGSQGLLIYDLQLLEPLAVIMHPSWKRRDNRSALDICGAKNGDLLISDANRCLVARYDSKGVKLFDFGVAGSGFGEFRRPTAVFEDSAGQIWVADRLQDRVSVFNPNGDFMRFVTISGGIRDLVIDSLGNMVVLGDNGGLTRFDNTGRFISRSSVPAGTNRLLAFADGQIMAVSRFGLVNLEQGRKFKPHVQYTLMKSMLVFLPATILGIGLLALIRYLAGRL